MEPVATITSKILKRKGKTHEYTFFFLESVFRCKCALGEVRNYLEDLNKDFKIYYENNGNNIKMYNNAERVVKKLVIFCSLCQCVRSKRIMRMAREVISNMSYFEDVFWFSKIIENFDRGGYWSVCRVVSSFRKLYRLDK